MRKKYLHILLLVHFAFFSTISFAQAPAEFNFQGMARGRYGASLMSQNIALRFSIRTGSADGTVVYRESRSVLTDSTGIFNAVIGGAGATEMRGRLDTIIWKAGSKFLQVEMDEDNGTDYINLGATQLLSVPFAMFSNNASYTDSSRIADSSAYARSSGAYFFEAVFPEGSTSIPAGNQTLIFPHTNYNHLNPVTGKPVYDSISGEFVAPADGIYQFDFAAFIEEERDEDNLGEPFFSIYKNDKAIRTHGYYDLLNNMHARINLIAGDRISIKFFSQDCCWKITSSSDDEDRFEGTLINYFSGYKIY